jgi:hypothetical protein
MPVRLAKQIWGALFPLSALSGWLCLGWLLSAPSEASSAVFLGYSIERLALAALLFLPAIVFTIFALKSWSNLNWLTRATTIAKPIIAKHWWFGVAGLILFAITWFLFFISPEFALVYFGSLSLYIERLKPILLFYIALAALWLPALLLFRYGTDFQAVKEVGRILRLGMVIFASLFLAAVLIGISGLGLGFDATQWNAPNAPLLSGQVFFCLLLAGLVLIAAGSLQRWRRTRDPGPWLDLALASLVWLLAAGIWMAQPAAPTYYSSPPQPPVNQSFPLSDAFNHDVIANNVLIGEGFRFGGQLAIRRPAYIMFLAGLEGLLGADYDAVVAAQVFVLALFPALLYLLGAKLHNRLSALFLAGLIIVRETNSIALGDVINTSHAKLLMVDLPAALMTAAAALAVVTWLRSTERSKLVTLLVGGLLGFAILLRSQSLTLLPFVILLALLAWGWRAAWRPALLLLLGALLVAGPWVVRNKLLMGQWVIEDAIVSGFLANRYSFTPGTFGLPFLQGETEGEYYARQMGRVRDFALQNPGYVAGFVVDNFVRNQILNFAAPPLSLQMRDAEAHVRQLPYWPSWDGRLPLESYLPMLANLLLFGVGLAAAWTQARWAGLVPLFLNFGFTSNLALARVSGWRYNLPVDWTVLFYYALGISQVVVWVLLLLRRAPGVKSFLAQLLPSRRGSRIIKEGERSEKVGLLAVVAGLLLLAGTSFSLIEAVSQPRYEKVDRSQAAALVTAAVGPMADKQDLLDLLQAGELGVFSGRALHPRYYRAGEGIAGRDSVLVAPMDFDRLTFYLIGPDPASVILPVSAQPEDFPASSDVFVFHCGDTLQAAAVIIRTEGNSDSLFVSPSLLETCSALGS